MELRRLTASKFNLAKSRAAAGPSADVPTPQRTKLLAARQAATAVLRMSTSFSSLLYQPLTRVHTTQVPMQGWRVQVLNVVDPPPMPVPSPVMPYYANLCKNLL